MAKKITPSRDTLNRDGPLGAGDFFEEAVTMRCFPYGLLPAALALLACASNDTSTLADGGPKEDAMDGDEPESAIRWEPIALLEGADHAVVEVPLDYENEGGATTVIEVFRLRSLGAEAHPLVLLQGGPGGDVAELSTFFWPGESLEALRSSHVIYLVNTRGLGEAGQTVCESLEPGWHASANAVEDLQDCLGQETAFLRSISTANSVRDLEYLRALLEIERWAVYGVSYGSMLAAAYAAIHPERFESVVLDGVLPASRDPLGEGADFALQSLALLRVDCAEQEGCPQEFSQAPRALIALLVERADAGWTVVVEDILGNPVEVEITRDRLMGVMAAYLSDTEARFELPSMLADAADGNAASLAEAIGTDGVGLDTVVHLAIMCPELWRENLELAPPSPDPLEAWFAEAFRRDYDQFCPSVVSVLGERTVSEPSNSPIRALLLSGEVDVKTPPEYGEEVAAGFVSSTHAVVPRHGHGVADSACGASLVLQFLREPESPLDDSCLQDAAPPWPEDNEDDIVEEL